MANLSTSGLDELIGGLEKIAEIPDATILEMLTAEAEVVVAEQKAALSTAYHGKYTKGITARSVKYSKKLKKSKDGKAIYVYPQGTRTDGNKRRVAEVAFINEYGTKKRGIPRRLTIRTANAKAEQAAAEAATEVYEKFLKSKNL